jgi:hypothetical protein
MAPGLTYSRTVAEGLPQGSFGSNARTCQLAESSGDLFFDHPEERPAPNDFASLEEVEQRLRLYEELSNWEPRQFEWKFNRKNLKMLAVPLRSYS